MLNVCQKKRPIVQLNLLLLKIILIQLITKQTTDFFTLLPACVSLLAAHTHTHTFNKCRGLPSISVCVFLICPPTEEEEEALSHHHRFFSINVTPASKIYSNLVPSPQYQSNYPVLAIYIPVTPYTSSLSLRHCNEGRRTFMAL